MLSVILSFVRLIKALWHAVKEPRFLSILTTVTLIILSGTLFYKNFEGWSLLDSVYFAVVSLIPTGVNTNLVPSTNGSKLFTILYLIIGSGLMFALLLTLGRSMIKDDDDKYKLNKSSNDVRKAQTPFVKSDRTLPPILKMKKDIKPNRKNE
nr:potassium channel family protein [Lysinibacillus timonensis]